ncbi:DUF805 domain-containing protein [Listeria fleischmannii]|nr:DUF805 domain-containing protein [Listeria fleischmannii]
MTFFKVLQSFWVNFANFKGRASRMEFWCNFILYYAIGRTLGLFMEESLIILISLSVFELILIIPLIVRRCNDANVGKGYKRTLITAYIIVSFLPPIADILFLLLIIANIFVIVSFLIIGTKPSEKMDGNL